MEFSKQFGARVRKLRRDQELSQDEIADRAGIHRTYLTSLEGGNDRSPTLEVANRLAKALGTPLSEIIRGIEEG